MTQNLKKPNPFDYLNAVSEKIENPIKSGKLPISDFNRFLLIRGLALHPDTLVTADTANSLLHISDELLYHFCHYNVKPKRKRIAKWPKLIKELSDDDINDFMSKHECSRLDAINALENS